LVGQAGGVQSDQLAAVAGTDVAQNQLGVHPDVTGRSTRLPAAASWVERLADRVAMDVGGVVVQDVAADHG
jgi:hypothetical protein